MCNVWGVLCSAARRADNIDTLTQIQAPQGLARDNAARDIDTGIDTGRRGVASWEALAVIEGEGLRRERRRVAVDPHERRGVSSWGPWR